MLWMTRGESALSAASLATLAGTGIVHERVDGDELRRRYPQINVVDGGWAIFEPHSGVLMARRAVQAVVADVVRSGGDFEIAAVEPLRSGARLAGLRTTAGVSIEAGTIVFACGAWLRSVVPDALGDRLFPTRQEVFFFGAPPGDCRFSSPALPAWIDFGDEFYGLRIGTSRVQGGVRRARAALRILTTGSEWFRPMPWRA